MRVTWSSVQISSLIFIILKISVKWKKRASGICKICQKSRTWQRVTCDQMWQRGSCDISWCEYIQSQAQAEE